MQGVGGLGQGAAAKGAGAHKAAWGAENFRTCKTTTRNPKTMEWSSLKSAGNDSYREGRVAEAESLYSQSITALQGAEAGCGDAKQRSELALERATVLVNRALARFQLGNLVDCIADCDDALRIDPGRVKALFRRAQVHVLPFLPSVDRDC